MKRTSLVASLALFLSLGILSAALVELTDADSDGMPDFWENAYGFNPEDPADASLDPDEDGMANLGEYRTDTHPLDFSSVLRFTAISLSANQVSCQFASRANVAYRVESSPSDFGPWSLLSPITGTGAPITISETASGGSRFYRLSGPGPTYAVNRVGYVKVNVTSGTNVITRPMLATADNSIDSLIPQPGQGTCLYKWNPAAQAYETACYSDGFWDNGTLQILPGDAFQVINAGTAFTLTFLGEVIPGSALLITSQPQSQTVLVGSNATFTVTASGEAPLGYQWFFNGSAIAGAGDPGFALDRVELADAGTYHVVVSNSFGAITSAVATLVVLPCFPAPPGLVAWWRAEGNALDSVAANHGVLSNGATFATGNVGQAFSFDGTNDYVTVNDSAALRFSTGFTVSAWVKLRQYSSNAIQPILHKDPQASAGQRAYFFGIRDRKVEVGVFENGFDGSIAYRDSNIDLPLSEWHHVAAVYQGQSTPRLDVYVDGVPRNGLLRFHDTFPVITSIPSSIRVNTQPVFIGAYVPGLHPFPGMFPGEIDELSAYNRALSSNEIAAIYAAGGSGLCPPQALQFAVQGSGAIVVDPQMDTYPFGTTVTIGAVPGRYHTFLRWSDGNTNSPRTITVGLSNNYTAIFTNTVPLENLLFTHWQQSFGGTNQQGLLALQQTTDGGYILGGWSSSPPGGNKVAPHYGDHDFWIIKLDAAGTKQWDKSYGGSGQDVLTALQQTTDGGYILGGISISGTNGNKTTPNYGDDDYWVIKTDGAGIPQWQRSFGGDGTDQLYSLQQTADGGYVLGGFSYSLNTGNKTATNYGGADYWVVKLDASGNKQWDKALGGNDADFCRVVRQLDNGGYAVAGVSLSSVSGTKVIETTVSRDFWVEVLDANGNEIDEHAVLHEGDESLTGLIALTSNDFLLAGWTTSPTFGQPPAQHHGSNDFAVARIALDQPQPTAAAERAYGGLGVDLMHAFESTSDAGFVAGGPSFSGITGDKTSSSFGDADFWIVKTDSAGITQWDLAFGGADGDFLNALHQTSDGGYILGGTSSSGVSGNKTTPLIGAADWWVIKLTPREAPVGTPVILFDGRFDPSNALLFTNAALLEIQSTFPGATIYFTLDGSDPDYGELYTGPLHITDNAVVRAVAYTDDLLDSAEADPVTVAIVHSPVILAHPESQTLPAGSTVALTVAVTGDTPLTYQWFKNEIAIGGATNAALVLFQTDADDAGAYSVVVANDYGSATSLNAFVSIIQPPSVVAQPTSASVPPNEPVEFCVGASGDPVLRFQWRKNGGNIPGATNQCLMIPAVTPADGGSYSVVVENSVGAVLSAPAILTIALINRPGGDLFAQRSEILDTCFVGSNVGATNEPGEPIHAGKQGGRSIWYTWRAPSDGIATFETRGSSFDTLLAVYTGPDVTHLTLVAADEDDGGFLSSRVRFNAVANANYEIVVDGYAASQGTFALCWDVAAISAPLPVILTHPLSRTVREMDSVTLSVVATSSLPDLKFQWFFNGMALNGALGPTLTIPSVLPQHVGLYRVAVSNSYDHQAFVGLISAAAVLEIGPNPDVQSVDKVADLRAPPATISARNGKPVSAGVTATGAGISVGAGSIDYQVINNTGSATSPTEPLPCRVLGGASRWLLLQPTNTATMRIDTMGSTIDTVLGVLTGSDPLSLVSFLCDDDGAPDASRNAFVRFTATAGTRYYVQADGKSGTNGIIYINWGLGFIPTNNQPFVTNRIRLGDNVTLTCAAMGVPAPTFYWRLGAQVIAVSTNAFLTLSNAQAQHFGVYSVIASNFIGSITNALVDLRVQTNEITAAQSTFDFNTENWSVVGANLIHSSVGGHSGAFVALQTIPGSGQWYWSAPAAYLGNKFYCYNGSLSFALRQSLASSLLPSGEDIILEGAGLRLVLDWPIALSPNWESYKIPLKETAGWRLGSLAGPVATRSQFLAVLTSLTKLMIRGEATPMTDIGNLDSVLLLAPATASLSLRTDGSNWFVEWPQALAGYSLQSATTWAPAGWAGVTQPPVRTNNLNTVQLPALLNQQFFRLHKP
jgi:hypothetical protein